MPTSITVIVIRSCILRRRLPRHEAGQCERVRTRIAHFVFLLARRGSGAIPEADRAKFVVDEQRFASFDENYPPTGFALDAKGNAKPLSGDPRPFRAFGPTCDSADVLPRPQMLPDTIATGDFVLFGSMGAYTVSSRSPFNGYFPDIWAIIDN